MRRTLMILLALFILLSGIQAQAQTATPRTALSAAITAGATSFSVLSVSGVPTPAAGTSVWAFVDGEAMQVTGISSTTLTVSRGQIGTAASTHQSGAMIFVGPQYAFVTTDFSGTCTRGNYTYLPRINVRNGNIWDCLLQASGSTAYLATTGTTSEWIAVNASQISRANPYKKLALSATTYTLLVSDEIVGYNTNVSGTITIPAITGMPGKTYTIQSEHTGAASITVATSSGQLINGATSVVFPGVGHSGGQYARVVIYSDGQNWFAGTNF